LIKDLRIATPDDFKDVRRLALSFYKASPYANLELDEEKLDQQVIEFLTGDPTKKIVILALHEEAPVGIIAGAVHPFLLNNSDTVAAETMWWLDEPYRKGRMGLRLLDAFEYWAKNVAHCSIAQMTRLKDSERIGKIYDKRGYVPAETIHCKLLGQV
jgi:GNAT superfamily N-acetyltransferase